MLHVSPHCAEEVTSCLSSRAACFLHYPFCECERWVSFFLRGAPAAAFRSDCSARRQALSGMYCVSKKKKICSFVSQFSLSLLPFLCEYVLSDVLRRCCTPSTPFFSPPSHLAQGVLRAVLSLCGVPPDTRSTSEAVLLWSHERVARRVPFLLLSIPFSVLILLHFEEGTVRVPFFRSRVCP